MAYSSIEQRRDDLVDELEDVQQQLSELLDSGKDIVHDKASEMEAEALINLISSITKEIEALENAMY